MLSMCTIKKIRNVLCASAFVLTSAVFGALPEYGKLEDLKNGNISDLGIVDITDEDKENIVKDSKFKEDARLKITYKIGGAEKIFYANIDEIRKAGNVNKNLIDTLETGNRSLKDLDNIVYAHKIKKILGLSTDNLNVCNVLKEAINAFKNNVDKRIQDSNKDLYKNLDKLSMLKIKLGNVLDKTKKSKKIATQEAIKLEKKIKNISREMKKLEEKIENVSEKISRNFELLKNSKKGLTINGFYRTKIGFDSDNAPERKDAYNRFLTLYMCVERYGMNPTKILRGFFGSDQEFSKEEKKEEKDKEAEIAEAISQVRSKYLEHISKHFASKEELKERITTIEPNKKIRVFVKDKHTFLDYGDSSDTSETIAETVLRNFVMNLDFDEEFKINIDGGDIHIEHINKEKAGAGFEDKSINFGTNTSILNFKGKSPKIFEAEEADKKAYGEKMFASEKTKLIEGAKLCTTDTINATDITKKHFDNLHMFLELIIPSGEWGDKTSFGSFFPIVR